MGLAKEMGLSKFRPSELLGVRLTTWYLQHEVKVSAYSRYNWLVTPCIQKLCCMRKWLPLLLSASRPLGPRHWTLWMTTAMAWRPGCLCHRSAWCSALVALGLPSIYCPRYPLEMASPLVFCLEALGAGSHIAFPGTVGFAMNQTKKPWEHLQSTGLQRVWERAWRALSHRGFGTGERAIRKFLWRVNWGMPTVEGIQRQLETMVETIVCWHF